MTEELTRMDRARLAGNELASGRVGVDSEGMLSRTKRWARTVFKLPTERLQVEA